METTDTATAPNELELAALRARVEKAWLERLLEGATAAEKYPDPKAAVEALGAVAALRR